MLAVVDLPDDRAQGIASRAVAREYWVEPSPASGVWRLCWTEHRRKRTRSLGTRDQAEAAQYLARFLDELAKPEQPERPTVTSLLDGFMATKSSAPLSRYVKASKPLKRHLGWMAADDLLPSHSAGYARKRRAEGVRNGTIKNELQKLSATLGWALGERLITTRPAISYPKAPRSRERWLTKREAGRLVASCRRHHIRLFVTLALCTAARKGALLDLTWDRVHWDRLQIELGEIEDGKPRAVVPINAMLLPILREAWEMAQTDRVIEWAGRPVTKIQRGFHAAARAGIQGVTPHDLRRTAATWMAMDGVPMRKISRYLGHSSEHITARVYAKFSPDYLKDAADALEW